MEGIKIFTAKQASVIATEANKDIINQTLDKIEDAAKQGLSELRLENPPEIVVRYLELQGFLVTNGIVVNDESGSLTYQSCDIHW